MTRPTPPKEPTRDVAADVAVPVPAGLSERDQRAVFALVKCRTVADAARVAGVSVRTIFRRLHDPTFAAALRGARRAVLDQARTRLVAATSSAVDALWDVVDDERAPPAARMAAAKTILESARGFVEVEDLAERLAAMEARMKAGGGVDDGNGKRTRINFVADDAVRPGHDACVDEDAGVEGDDL